MYEVKLIGKFISVILLLIAYILLWVFTLDTFKNEDYAERHEIIIAILFLTINVALFVFWLMWCWT